MTSKKQPTHPFLAQMLFCPIDSSTHVVPCQGAVHRGKVIPPSSWEVRFYQDADRMVALYLQGVSQEEIADTLWNAACKEQDSVGIVIHKTMHLCDECTEGTLSRTGGDAGAFIQFTTSVMTRQPILLVSDRLTEQAGLLGGLPAGINEQDILQRLDTEDMLHIQF